MDTPFYNLIWFGVLLFGLAFFVLGLLGQAGAISILRGTKTASAVLMGVGATLLCGGIVVWGALDLLKGPGDSMIIKWVGDLANSVINQSVNPWKK